MTAAELDGKLRAMIVRHAGPAYDSERIGPHTDLVEELQMDSMMIVHLFAELEEEFRIRIRVQDIETPILSEYRYLHDHIGGLIERGTQDGA
jgi:acyl carrier protein